MKRGYEEPEPKKPARVEMATGRYFWPDRAKRPGPTETNHGRGQAATGHSIPPRRLPLALHPPRPRLVVLFVLVLVTHPPPATASTATRSPPTRPGSSIGTIRRAAAPHPPLGSAARAGIPAPVVVAASVDLAPTVAVRARLRRRSEGSLGGCGDQVWPGSVARPASAVDGAVRPLAIRPGATAGAGVLQRLSALLLFEKPLPIAGLAFLGVGVRCRRCCLRGGGGRGQSTLVVGRRRVGL